MALNHDIIRIAKKKAMQSNCNYKVAALGFNKKFELVCTAFNRHRFVRKGGSIHAEMAIMKEHPKSIKTIIICRFGRSGDPLPIRPCQQCQTKAIELGIRIRTID